MFPDEWRGDKSGNEQTSCGEVECRIARHRLLYLNYNHEKQTKFNTYCIHRNFSNLTIIAIIATQSKNAIKVVAIFFIALYVIYKLETNR